MSSISSLPFFWLAALTGSLLPLRPPAPKVTGRATSPDNPFAK